jgi:hypothetical protein
MASEYFLDRMNIDPYTYNRHVEYISNLINFGSNEEIENHIKFFSTLDSYRYFLHYSILKDLEPKLKGNALYDRLTKALLNTCVKVVIR